MNSVVGRTAWLVVALLWPVALLNYLDRQMLAAMKFSVMGDIPSIATDANWGRMLGQRRGCRCIIRRSRWVANQWMSRLSVFLRRRGRMLNRC